MNEPIRMRDDPDAPSELREALSHARPSRRMSAAEFARNARRISLGTAAFGGLLFWLKGVAWAALIGAGGGLIFVGAKALGQDQSRPTESLSAALPAVVSALPRPVRSTPAPTPPAAEPEQVADEAPAATTSATKDAAPAAPERDSLAEEADLIERARRLSVRDPNAALGLLAEHQRRFAHGKLGMERELLRVDALRRAGRTAEARALVESLLARSQKSIYEARLRQLLESLGGSSTP